MKPIKDIKDKLIGGAQVLAKSGRDVVVNLRSHAKHAWNSVQHRTGRVLRESATYVRKNPLPATLIACGIGLALRLLLRRRAPTPKAATLAKPLLVGLFIATGAMLRRAFSPAGIAGEASTPANETANGAVKPLKKSTRRIKRSLSH
jgi:ElaB/YqjD/DUF883 family membrane-anchored ribosome-binding protein